MSSDLLAGRRIGISVSDSANLGALGFGPEHVEDVMVELTRYLVMSGAIVVYGGDLRAGGFTELLIEVVARHVALDDASVHFENYLAWPVHAGMRHAELDDMRRSFEPAGRLICLDPAGHEMAQSDRSAFDSTLVAESEWGPALTAMRRRLAQWCDARIVAGGKIADYRGAMPGVAEEAALSIAAGKPTYVLGCLGGCALDIGVEAGLGASPLAGRTDWRGRAGFSKLGHAMNRGLGPSEAAALASVPHSTEMLVLLFKGLYAELAPAPTSVQEIGYDEPEEPDHGFTMI